MSQSCDVVVVPDFSNQNRAVFEARTLFFLASWLEHAGNASSWPLHLACIGEPPESVRRLGERCHASVTVHEPLSGGDRLFTNKLWGLEVAGRTDRVLLLDADVLVLSDISGLCELGNCVAAAPSFKPRIPTSAWRAVYRALGVELPAERIKSVRGAVAAAVRRWYQSGELEAMVPYYNAGIILAPWRCDLRSIWKEHLGLIADSVDYEGDAADALAVCDQAAFATAVQVLRQRGFDFAGLPFPYHPNFLHQQARFDAFLARYNHERPHQALGMKVPGELYAHSPRPYQGLGELDYPDHDWTVTVTRCGRICYTRRKINLSRAFAGQNVGVKQVSEKIWLVSFMHYDLGYFDDEICRLEPIENPFSPKVLPMSPE